MLSNLIKQRELFNLIGQVHREIVPPRETVAIARVAIAIVERGGWGSLPYGGKWKSNEGIDNIANGPVNNMSFFML